MFATQYQSWELLKLSDWDKIKKPSVVDRVINKISNEINDTATDGQILNVLYDIDNNIQKLLQDNSKIQDNIIIDIISDNTNSTLTWKNVYRETVDGTQFFIYCPVNSYIKIHEIIFTQDSVIAYSISGLKSIINNVLSLITPNHFLKIENLIGKNDQSIDLECVNKFNYGITKTFKIYVKYEIIENYV